MKLAVIGGGGFRTPAMYEALLAASGALQLAELVLHDADEARLRRIDDVLRGIDAERGERLARRTTTDVDDAIEGAQFVLCALRVGGLPARLADEQIPLELGLLGQETVGAGGLCAALRTVPVVLDVAERVAARAPGAWFLDYTNPAGLVTEALQEVLGDRVVGICDSPVALTRGVAGALGRGVDELRFDYGGLNHLGWLKAVRSGERDLLPDLLADDARLARLEEGRVFGPELLRALGRIPSEYLAYYYFSREVVEALRAGEPRAALLIREQEAFYAGNGRARRDALAAWRAAVRRRSASYLDEVHRARRIPGGSADELPPDGGLAGYTSVALGVVRALATGAPAVLFLNTANRGAIPFLDERAVVEVPCEVGARGVRPLPSSEWTLHEQGLVSLVKDAERAAIEAARRRSRSLAVRALALHPLVGSVEAATSVLDRHLARVPELREQFAARR
ncbi:MAG: 6-phospho-beta-glucosidase [Thermoleophilia bacterium]|nr:6-phospho-beta-glucosidase [Thermoleophilia bacterium]